MRALFLILLLLHGAIHFLGFAKAYKLAELHRLSQPISRGNGLFWGLCCILFLVAAALFAAKNDFWWIAALSGVALSQVLVFSAWSMSKFATLPNLIILAASIAGLATLRFHYKYEKDVERGLIRSSSIPEALLTEADLEPLPLPVQKYLRYAGVLNRPKVRHFKIIFEGRIRENEKSEWMPFTSEQYNFMDVPTRLFFMKASMKDMPVAGYHAYRNGEAFMDIRLFSLIKVQYQSGEKMGVAETVTFFNDMCCLAPATLIDPRIDWIETRGNTVKAAFENNGVSIEAWLHFNEKGQLISFESDDRYAVNADGSMTQLPWFTPLKNYQRFHGVNLPGTADAVYKYPAGDLVYGTFKTVDVVYNAVR